jgi:apolipoprotein D and lipocalin family protein
MGNHSSVQPVPELDLERYKGKWYEMARLPQGFEKHCVNVIANYEIVGPRKIKVTNSCMKTNRHGREDFAYGYAKPDRHAVLDGSIVRPAMLKVAFFRPFYAQYWVLYIDQDYRYAIVGSCNKNDLWILSRNQFPPQRDVDALIERARQMGYDVSKLEKNIQQAELENNYN